MMQTRPARREFDMFNAKTKRQREREKAREKQRERAPENENGEDKEWGSVMGKGGGGAGTTARQHTATGPGKLGARILIYFGSHAAATRRWHRLEILFKCIYIWGPGSRFRCGFGCRFPSADSRQLTPHRPQLRRHTGRGSTGPRVHESKVPGTKSGEPVMQACSMHEGRITLSDIVGNNSLQGWRLQSQNCQISINHVQGITPYMVMYCKLEYWRERW